MNTANAKKRVVLIGGGTIGGTIIDAIATTDIAEIAAIVVRDTQKARAAHPAQHVTDSFDDALRLEPDLIVEAAHPDVVRALAPQALQTADFCAFSLTALADEAFAAAITKAARVSGRQFYAPHGAVLAMDGLADGRSALESVTVTTTKSAKSFGLPEDTEGLALEGTAREACARFPRNVNVHAAVAIAGLGFDRTQSRIIVEPQSPRMVHHIEAKGDGLEWSIDVVSQSLGGVTGSYTPVSAAGSVFRILGGVPGIVIA